MRKVKFYLGTGFTGCNHTEVMEFDDNTTEKEIEECYEEWKDEKLDCSWWDEEWKENDILKIDIFNTENKYQIIYADPLWRYKEN